MPISIKSAREIELMREAGRLLAEVHEELAAFIKPGISTKELDKLVEKYIIDSGATPACKGYEGYPATLCTSVNEVIVHGIPNENVIVRLTDINCIPNQSLDRMIYEFTSNGNEIAEANYDNYLKYGFITLGETSSDLSKYEIKIGQVQVDVEPGKNIL